MSVSVMSLVWDKAPFKGSDLIIFLALADWSDDSGVSWPSIKTLSIKARQSERTTQYCLRELESLGYLKVTKRKENSSRYTINIDKLYKGAKIAPPAVDGVQDTTVVVQTDVNLLPESAPNTSLYVNQDQPPQTLSSLPGILILNGTTDFTQVQRIFEYYLAKIGRNPKTYTLTPVRKQKGLARYRDCLKITGQTDSAVAMMMLCIDKLAASEFHMAGGYIEWDKQLFGSEERLQFWLNRTEGRNGKPSDTSPEPEDALVRERREEEERNKRRLQK